MHIIFDGKNCAMRAAYACKRGETDSRRSSYHPVVQFAKHCSEVIEKFKPTTVSCVWDTPRETVWRKQIFPLYKNRENNTYIEGLKEYVIKIEEAAHILFPEAKFRVFKKATQEADDIIYSLCKSFYPDQVIIVSSDKDFTQITYRTPTVRLYDPQDKIITPTPSVDPIISKSLIGDTSDRIDGYHGIGKVKGTALASSRDKRAEFLAVSGVSLYLRNLMLINLAYNPSVINNDIYVESKLATPVKFDKKALERLSIEHKIFGVMQDYDTAFMPMQLYIDKQVDPVSYVEDGEEAKT